jgi:hypothetical protein
MYIQGGAGLRQVVAPNLRARSGGADRWQREMPMHGGFGEPVAPIPPCIPTPPWLTLFKHYVVAKEPRIASHSPFRGGWETTAAVSPLKPDTLNPGYIHPTTGALRLDPNLDPKLKALMGNLFAGRPPFDKDPYKRFVSNGGKIRVALVDLSTDKKSLFPTIAEYNSSTMTYAASLAKIGALYGAYQLKFDLNAEAKKNPQAMTAARVGALKKMFDVTRVGSPPTLVFDFNNTLLRPMNEICENSAAAQVIMAIGFRYLASALWQSGLYDCRRGGIWLGSSYGGSAWNRDPIANQSAAVNALSVATYFTLLAQGRLISAGSSRSIKMHLVAQRAFCRSFFEEGLRAVRQFTNDDYIYSKIGIYETFYHEGALIHHCRTGKKYVAAVLTEAGAGFGADILSSLIAQLDSLVRTNP